jgi:hypothetical protein
MLRTGCSFLKRVVMAMRLSLLVIAVLTLGVCWASTLPAPVDYSKISAVDLVNRTAKGGLHNPYKDSQANIVAQGEALFRSYPCAGCHGGNAGGGMCPPLTAGYRTPSLMSKDPGLAPGSRQAVIGNIQ